jgi:hypothetical protein
MDKQRLKFAYARGARLQRLVVGNWWPTTMTHAEELMSSRYCELRIDPRDAHLEYGPLSTALRVRVVYADWNAGCVAALEAARTFGFSQQEIFYATDDEHLFFWLFIAEYLADQGL